MKYTKKDIPNILRQKVDSLGTHDAHKNLIFERIMRYPKEIEENILQWLNNEPITEIDCHGMSMKYVIDTCKLNDSDMLWLIDNFATYAERDFQVYSDCFGMFMHT